MDYYAVTKSPQPDAQGVLKLQERFRVGLRQGGAQDIYTLH